MRQDEARQSILQKVQTTTQPLVIAKQYLLSKPLESAIPSGFIISAAGGLPRKVCDECSITGGWLSDDRRLLIRGVGLRYGDPNGTLSLLNVESGNSAPVVLSGGQRLLVAPNERWIAFDPDGQIFLAPFRPGQPPSQAEWISVVSREAGRPDRICGWSPDSRLLYVLLERDGFRCLYAVRIDPATGRPVGDLFPVYHFHQASLQWGSTGFGNAVVNGLFVSLHREISGNIWMTSLKP